MEPDSLSALFILTLNLVLKVGREGGRRRKEGDNHTNEIMYVYATYLHWVIPRVNIVYIPIVPRVTMAKEDPNLYACATKVQEYGTRNYRTQRVALE